MFLCEHKSEAQIRVRDCIDGQIAQGIEALCRSFGREPSSARRNEKTISHLRVQLMQDEICIMFQVRRRHVPPSTPCSLPTAKQRR